MALVRCVIVYTRECVSRQDSSYFKAKGEEPYDLTKMKEFYHNENEGDLITPK